MTVISRRGRPAVLAAVVGACVAASVFIGARPSAPADVLAVLFDGPAAAGGALGDLGHVVWGLRIPRTLLGLAAGATLALAGAIAQ